MAPASGGGPGVNGVVWEWVGVRIRYGLAALPTAASYHRHTQALPEPTVDPANRQPSQPAVWLTGPQTTVGPAYCWPAP
eukprot:359636-Chlamydomonas_euryale.AAC.9